jgi:hypothetical protein
MRLFEVEDRFASDLEMVLRNLMGRANKKGSPLEFSYAGLSNLMKNMGYGSIDYNGFDKIYQTNPSVQAIIQNYNEDGIIVSTDEVDPEDQEQIEQPTGPSVGQMASSAAQDFTNDLSN